jgi:serine-type D-Ala-D-Ala carboxypeptidase/endopeptidase (penicillin-binding protein 4)
MAAGTGAQGTLAGAAAPPNRRRCGFGGPSGAVASLARVVRRSPSSRLAAALAALVALAAPAAAAASPESGLQKSLRRAMSDAGPEAGAFVRDGDNGHRLFAWSHTKLRILASNTKLFTLGAALSIHGPEGRLRTLAAAAHPLKASGVVSGNLYLVGGGDPAFGSGSFVRQEYGGGGGATAEKLAEKLRKAGLREVRGRVYGDESLFDSSRSGPGTNATEVGGVLSALAYNHGLTLSHHLQDDPAAYAAEKFTDALRGAGVKVGKSARRGRAPDGAAELAHGDSLPMARLGELTALPSDNYFAELLAKGLGGGTTAGGARAIVSFTKERGAKLRLVDGSGLSRSDRAAPQEVVQFLDHEQDAAEYGALFRALPIAGVNGTLADRMRSGYAHHNCRAKTGTLIDVSALSGYCKSRGGHTLIFSILMNGVGSISHAQSLQDTMAESMARYQGGG